MFALDTDVEQAFAEAFANLRKEAEQNGSPSVKIWLLLNVMLEYSQNITSCLKLAVYGNSHYPGTFEGVITSPEVYFASAHLIDRTGEIFSTREEQWETIVNATIAKFTDQGLRFGLKISPTYCFELLFQVPEAVVNKIDEMFYIEEESVSFKIENAIPQLTVSEGYERCKGALEQGARNLHYAFPDKYLILGSGLRPICLLSNYPSAKTD